MVLLTQFNSLRQMIIVMTSVLLSLTGVFIGLLVTGTPFGIIMTGIGVISLAGVVVNNAIVLIDYINQLRRNKIPLREALIQAGLVRFRPVMLTALTTILGLFPMAVGVSFDFRNFAWEVGGESAQWWGPMAVAVIFGLAVATLLTLVVIPVLYSLFHPDRPETNQTTTHFYLPELHTNLKRRTSC
jgi:multidrug efflux pump subunit AcrB